MPGTIVVGVDGSAASHEALRWAAQEASLRGARLVAVHAWTFAAVSPIGDPGMILMPAVDYPDQLEAEQRAARAGLDDAVVEALGATPASKVEKRLVENDAGEALVEASASADLVVVGSHGRSGLKAAVLGSVSRHVVERAACPVVVVKVSS
jgi:nucleotide-binding universal stress UspA family protein